MSDERRPEHIKLVTSEPAEEKVKWPCLACGHSIDLHVGGNQPNCYWSHETCTDLGLTHTVVRSLCMCELPPSVIVSDLKEKQ